jgi:large subunit ribosomal protein L10
LAISKEQKDKLLMQYEEAVTTSRGMIITEYRGMSAPDLGRLRAAIREANGSYNVVKLTLFKLALERAGLPVPEEMFGGPVAVGFCHQDVPAVAKAFKDFSRDQELLVVKGGLMRGRVISKADVTAIADLPPIEVVRAQLIGIISGPARNLVGAVAGGVRQVVNVLNAYAEKDKQEAGAEV